MIDKRQIMYDIERCICHVPGACMDCSHYTGTVGFKCMENLMSDALAAMKEQEARVMTLEEVKAFNWEYCYLEEERSPGNEYRAVCGDYALTCITWPCVTSMRTQHGDENYGRKWRCWSAKPTNEQMKAAKWE